MFEKRYQYDTLHLYHIIQKEIEERKGIVLLGGVIFSFLLFILVPFAFWLFFGLLFFADLPVFDQGLIGLFRNTKLFLLPYLFLLLFYFIAMYLKDKKGHLKNKKHYKKAIRFLIMTLLIVVLPYIFTNDILLTILFFLFFIRTVYYLSLTYYDIALEKAYNIHDHPYVLEDFGWMTSMGLIDNPLTMRDDMNRAKIFVQVSTLGFDFIVTFINLIVKSTLFMVAIRNKHYVHEAVRLLHVILEEREEGEYQYFSVYAKVILEQLNYVSFSNGTMMIHPHTFAIKKLVIKEEKI